MTKSIWGVGKKLKLIKEQGEQEGEEKDGDIKEQKRRVGAALKKWCNSRDEGDKAELREEKKRFKEIKKIKAEERRARKRERLENSRTMADFWAAIREHRPRRKRRGGILRSIEKEKWEEQFKKLLGGTEEEKERVELEGDAEEEGRMSKIE